MSTITINNVSVAAAAVANDIGAASGADTAAKVKTILGTTDAELNQLENIVASGIDAIADGSVYRRTSDAEVTQVENIIASGIDAIKDGSVYRRTSDAEVTKVENIIASGLDAVQNGAVYGRTTVAGAADANSIAVAAGAAVADRLLTLVKTVDGAGSGLDADLLDGKTTGTTSASGIVPVTLASGKLDNSFLNNASATVSGISSIISASGIVTGTDNTQFMTVSGLRAAADLAGMWLTKRTKMPDGATAVYSANGYTETTGYSSEGSPPSVLSIVNGNFRCAYSGSTHNRFYYSIAGVALSAKTVRARVRGSRSGIVVNGYNGTPSRLVGAFTLSPDWQIICFQLPPGSSNWGFFQALSNCVDGDYFEISNVWIGDYSYLTGSLSEEAARIADQLGDTAGVGVAASGTITASLTTLPTATKGDTIAGKKYTYVDALTASPGVEGEVLKDAAGATDADKCKNTLENLNLAMSETARTNNGTKYWAAAVHPLVSTTRTNEVLTITAKSTGILGNQITVNCESGTNHTASGTTLTGGIDDVGAKLSYQVARSSQQLTAKTSGVQADYEMLLDSANGFIKKKVLKSNLETTTQAAGKRALYNAAAGLNANSISFPATQVASSDANTLDDYEEGTWTPTIIGSSTAGTQTYSSQIGHYTKIGREVSVEFFVAISAKDAAIDGNVLIGGLPFAVAISYASGVAVGIHSGITYPTNRSYLALSPTATLTTLRLVANGSGAGEAAVPVASLSATSYLTSSLTYRV